MGFEIFGDFFTNEKIKINLKNEFCFNLEGPVMPSSYKIEPQKNKVNLRMNDLIFDEFESSPKFVTLANNHLFDFKEAGAESTKFFLDKKKIDYIGIDGKFIYRIFDDKIAIINVICESSGIKDNGDFLFVKSMELPLLIKKEKEENHKVILIVHWGDEECKYPSPQMVDLAHSFIKLGVDLIVGHHAHIMQSVEVFQGKHIIYGIGNMIFDDL